ncbi:MAG: hypothetical protein FJ304_00960 [Planctomycetes bacterium]|nr:hypothetical protein [Planctomycetota bacterium]
MDVARGTRTALALRVRGLLPRRAPARAAGFALAALAVFALGELYLRVAPPGDIAPYLADHDRPGPFRADPEFGVQYTSLEALAADNAERFEPYRPLFNNPGPRVWAYFGTSFAHAPGMLADHTRGYVPQRVTFNLGRNEPYPVRLAQIALLLDGGLKPERVFLVTIPMDSLAFVQHGLDQYRATPSGALAYAPRMPAVGGALVRNSRLALKGWTRTRLHLNRPFYHSTAINTRTDPASRADLRTVFGHLAARCARHGVPVTVVLLPSHEQVLRGAGTAAQETFAEEARAVGFDVCDVTPAFRKWPDRAALFMPDKHFSDTGNRLLLAEMIAHLKATDPRAADLPEMKP